MAFDKKKFKESLKATFKNLGDSAKKVLHNVDDPLKDFDAKMKKNLGDLY